jgi:hypothetical protein
MRKNQKAAPRGSGAAAKSGAVLMRNGHQTNAKRRRAQPAAAIAGVACIRSSRWMARFALPKARKARARKAVRP